MPRQLVIPLLCAAYTTFTLACMTQSHCQLGAVGAGMLLQQLAAWWAALLALLDRLLRPWQAACVTPPAGTPPEPEPDALAAIWWFHESDGPGLEAQRAAFEAAFSQLGYCGGGQLAARRADHFPQLAGATYLDHAAATLYSVQQLATAQRELGGSLFCNPHSQLGGGGLDASAGAITQLRRLTLEMLRAPAHEYEVVLTSGATAALKLAGEAFPWSARSCCAYSTANHNSALGVRQLALAAGASLRPVDLQQLLQQQLEPQPHEQQQQQPQSEGADCVHSMLVVPAECNFSGTRYDAQRILQLWRQQQQAQQLAQQQEQPAQARWWLLVDAAKACSSHPPDCSDGAVDMLALSYYKVFGHPTGLGALLVRRSLLPLLLATKAYFGGGTVEVSLPDAPHVVRRQGAAGLEDGTLPFTSIAAARHGFRQLADWGGFDAIDRHMACLAWHAMAQLLALTHANGRSAAVLYCQPDVLQLLQAQQGQQQQGQQQPLLAPPPPGVLLRFRQLQGPVVTFNLVRPDGSWVGHREVAKLAAIHNICLRTGCFCNPGACAHHLGLQSRDLLANHAAGHVCWDDHDLLDGRPTGAVRASFGYMSSHDDLALLLAFLRRFFLDNDAGLNSTAAGQAEQAAAAAANKAAAEVANGVAAAGAAAAPAAPAANGVAAGAAGSRSTCSTCASTPSTTPSSSSSAGSLAALFLYPIKSCAPQQVDAWPLGPNGLLFDREWALVGPDGAALGQKQHPRLTQLRPVVDLAAGVMRVSTPGMRQALVVPLAAPACNGSAGGGCAGQQQAHRGGGQALIKPAEALQQVRVCGDSVCSEVVAGQLVATAASSAAAAAAGVPGGKAAAAAAAAEAAAVQAWFSEAVGAPCRLVRQVGNSRSVKRPQPQRQVRQQQQEGQQQQPNGLQSPNGLQQGVVGSSSNGFDTATSASSTGGGTSSTSGNAIGGSTSSTSSTSSDNASGGSTSSTCSSNASGGSSAGKSLGFANEGQFLLVNQASVDWVGSELTAAAGRAYGQGGSSSSRSSNGDGRGSACAAVPDAVRFRPNLVVSGFQPWAEDGWRCVCIGGSRAAAAAAGAAAPSGDVRGGSSSRGSANGVQLEVVGACGRCDMIRIDQATGQRHGGELLSLLARQRRQGGRLHFGVLLAQGESSSSDGMQQQQAWLQVGDAVHCIT